MSRAADSTRKASHEMRQTILRLHRELGLTILLSSHLLNEVEQLCTRIAVLNQGRKVLEGPLAEIKRREKLVRLVVDDFARRGHPPAAGRPDHRRPEWPASSRWRTVWRPTRL